MFENYKNNLIIGRLALIVSLVTLAFFPIVIFIGAKLHILGIAAKPVYLLTGFLASLILSSGIIFIISLIKNIKESKKIKTMSKGLKYTLISIAPVFICYGTVMIKALTEGH